MTAPKVAIVGGGASGTLLALQLLRQARQPLEVVLIEPRRHLGRGLAYDSPHVEHLLNVPAGRMSALPDEPDHFARWLQRAVGHAVGGRFVPRQIYGLYLQETLEAARDAAFSGVRLTHVEGAVENVIERRGAASLCVSGLPQVIRAQHVALALGNLQGQGPFPALAGHPFYTSDPWAPGALEQVGRGEDVLLVGSGLTMVDIALTLTATGRRRPLVAISRHGLLPQAHATRPSAATEPIPLSTLPPRARSWLRAMRQACAGGSDWRAAIDAQRPLSTRSWRRLDLAEQRRFLRHVRPYWETRRHRLAPEVAHALRELLNGGGLSVRAGRIASTQPVGAEIEIALAPRGGAEIERLRFGRVINATGPETDVARTGSPLMRQLLRDGVVRPDALRLGLDATPVGQLLDRSGRPSDVLFALGPLLRGVLWETTAVPEIRQQAAQLARTWLAACAHTQPPQVAEAVSIQP